MIGHLHGFAHVFIAFRFLSIHLRGFDRDRRDDALRFVAIHRDIGFERLRIHLATPVVKRGSAVKRDGSLAIPRFGMGERGKEQEEQCFHGAYAHQTMRRPLRQVFEPRLPNGHLDSLRRRTHWLGGTPFSSAKARLK